VTGRQLKAVRWETDEGFGPDLLTDLRNMDYSP